MKIKLLSIVFVFFALIFRSEAQVTIVSDGLNNTTTLFTLSGAGGAYFTGNSGVSDGVANSPFASEGTHSRGVINSNTVLTTTSNVDSSLFTGIAMTMRLASFSLLSAGNGADGTDIVTVEVSPDGGTTYYPTVRVLGNSNAYWSYTSGTGIATTPYDGNVTPVDFVPAGGGSRTTDGYSTVTVTGLPTSTMLKFRITLLNNSANEQWVIDDFKVTGTPTGPYTVVSGDWNVGTTWSTGLVPLATDNVTILAAHTVYTTASLTRTGTTTVNGGFELRNGGYASGTNFTYNATTGTLNFNTTGGYAVANTDVYWPTGATKPYNVNVLQGGIVLANNAPRIVDGLFTTANGGVFGVVITSPATLTLNGTCRINTGGFFQTGTSPIFGAASTLQYNTGGTFGRGLEWSALGVGTIGVTQGYPNNVQLSNNTTLNYTNGTPMAKAINGNLTVDAGSSFFMDYGSVTSGGFLTVAGNVSVAGSLSLGFANLDDLKIGGNLSFTGTGNLIGNNRAIFFIRNGNQTISSAIPLTIPYVVFQPASGSTTIQLLSSLTVSAPLAGNAISFNSASDIFNINGNTLTVGTATIANTIFGLGTISGSTTSNLTLLGTGSVGTLNFTAGFQNLGTFVMNRQAATIGCVMGTTVTVNTTLTLTAGLINLGNNFMTIGAAGTTTGGSANSFVVADVANGVNASLRKVFSAASAFTYPIGDGAASANGSEYSPATITFTGGTYGGYAGVSVDDLKNPNLIATVDFITRYWSLNISGITPTSYSVAANYYATDVNGTEANCISKQWNGSVWLNGSNAGTNTLTISGITTVPAINHITKGLRDAEINVVVGATNYLHNSIYDFGTVDTGSLNNVIFTVQNTGERPLTLAGPNTIIGTPPYSFFSALTVGNLAGGGTRNFTIRFAPTAIGTFTGSVTIPNGDTTGGEAPYIINFTGIAVLPAPEINVRGVIGANPNIVSGDITPSALDNTQFASTAIGSNQIKTFRVENLGTANLVLSSISNVGGNPGDFVISATIPPFIAFPAGTLDFSIAFTPTFVGYRSTTLTIGHNDPDDAVELPTYNFKIEGTATCVATANTVTPNSGPVGTEVTINATSNNLTGATVSFNGVPAVSITYVSATQIKVLVPVGATSGILTTTNSNGCTASNPFTVINVVNAACEGATTNFTDIIISEIYDSFAGSSGVIELYNPTLFPINMSTNSYVLARFTDLGAPVNPISLTGTIPARGTYLVAADATSTVCTGLTFPQMLGVGFNANDKIELRKFTSTVIDVVIAPNEVGYSIKRLITATGPTPTFNASDWTFTSNEDCIDLGYFSLVGNLPTVTLQPTYIPSCKSTTLTVAGAEGFAGGLGLTYQWFGVAPNVATWTSLTNTGVYSGTTTTTLTIANLAGLDNYQFYCQIRENTNICYVASNPVKIIEAQTVTFNTIGGWTPSAPTSSKIAVINGNYDTTINGDIDACSLIINNPYVATITGSHYINIENDFTNNGTLNIQNNGSLVQVNNNGVNSGTGTFNMTRDVSMRKYDYVYWSSPVPNFPVSTISPTTAADHIWKWIPTVGGDFGNWTNTSENMIRGKGYIVRGPSGFTTTPATHTATFTASGASGNYPFNGNVTTPIERGANQSLAGYTNPLNGINYTRFDDNLNLVGNPFPSAIKSLDFLNNNTNIEGAVRIWTHGALPAAIVNPFYGSFAYNYSSNDYIVYNGVGTLSGPAGFNGYIAAGQGFFITMNDGPADNTQTVSFNNTMRSKTYNNSQFYRMSNASITNVNENATSRIWLDIVGNDGKASRTLIGYTEGATFEKDRMYDASIFLDGNQNIYSLINNERMTIQGRSVPFINSDLVPIGFQSAAVSTYKIAIAATDGLFEGNSQPIYLEDKLLNIIFDLRQAPYVFTSNVGKFDERFVLRYTNAALSNVNYQNDENSVVVFVKTNQINIKSNAENIASCKVYDVLGREIYSKENIKQNEFSINEIRNNHQALIVRTTLVNGQIVSRKIVF